MCTTDYFIVTAAAAVNTPIDNAKLYCWYRCRVADSRCAFRRLPSLLYAFGWAYPADANPDGWLTLDQFDEKFTPKPPFLVAVLSPCRTLRRVLISSSLLFGQRSMSSLICALITFGFLRLFSNTANAPYCPAGFPTKNCNYYASSSLLTQQYFSRWRFYTLRRFNLTIVCTGLGTRLHTVAMGAFGHTRTDGAVDQVDYAYGSPVCLRRSLRNLSLQANGMMSSG